MTNKKLNQIFEVNKTASMIEFCFCFFIHLETWRKRTLSHGKKTRVLLQWRGEIIIKGERRERNRLSGTGAGEKNKREAEAKEQSHPQQFWYIW